MFEIISAVQQSPVTGDNFSPVLIAVVAGAAVIGLIVTTILSKNKK